ncbi:Uncharacterised protein [Mycobacterium tuberculosis]|nr:Uncharacterised protein [Mycobacterium tuberculosis]
MLHCNPEFLHVVRPKTPRGDGNHRGSPALDHAPLVVSSDPKPREGTETRKRRASSDRLLVVRPKTPRGDGNFLPHAWATAFDQVVRPKTPRGDGNNTSVARHTPTNHQVVRPKTPRGDGNTNASSFPASISACRQTQNPERGRKRVKPPPASPGPPRSSDPKPREGTETLGIPCADSGFACRQTQNPERGRKPGEQRRRQPGGHGSVVRPKTPRGDGNRAAFDTRSS